MMANSNRQPYVTATALTQSLLDACQENESIDLRMIVQISAGGQTIYLSNRDIYVGEIFYRTLTNLPTIRRTIGEWLSSEFEFSTLELTFNNADGQYNNLLPGGANYDGWAGNAVTVRIGLREVLASYQTIFEGTVIPEGGFSRSVSSITLRVRDLWARINRSMPTTVFTRAAYPQIDSSVEATSIPIIYGDWTVDLLDLADVPAFVVNGADIMVDFDATKSATFSLGSPDVWTVANHNLASNDAIYVQTTNALPDGYAADTTYYVSVIDSDNFSLSASSGPGSLISSTTAGAGEFSIKASENDGVRKPIQCVVSENDLGFLDSANVFYERSGVQYQVPSSDVSVGAGNNSIVIAQNPAGTWVEGEPLKYGTGDGFFVRVRGPGLGGYQSNIVEQARSVLLTYGGASVSDFDSTWDTYRDKAAPAQSAIANIKSRVWIQEKEETVSFCQALFEQVRLEFYVSLAGKLSINSLHFEDWVPDSSFIVTNTDIEKGSFAPKFSDKTNFTRALGQFAFCPNAAQNSQRT